ncbi:alpha/beta fold hydrolase, partial [Nocardiopsis sp. MG754419]|uniref:alpha/beta fold hydrolase n=1 Tax=Nocardiopsis sp. MG754419 TaxID=2259865 RepID=UPI0035B3D2B9|nr:prolyl aminopeptidase [Nocardiopsis sp. MG754419]
TFARLVTHYWSHACFLSPGRLLEGVTSIAHLPAVLINGRLDISGPSDTAYDLAARWPAAELVIVDDAAHTTNVTGVGEALTRALDRFRAL